MNTSFESKPLSMPASPADLAGVRFYQPGVIAAYCALCLPVGMCLYGLNLLRRGERVMGYALTVLSAITYLLAVAGSAMGINISGFGIVGIFAAIYLLKMEDRPYRRVMSRGGVRARWWPPFLWALGAFVIVIVVTAFAAPAS